MANLQSSAPVTFEFPDGTEEDVFDVTDTSGIGEGGVVDVNGTRYRAASQELRITGTTNNFTLKIHVKLVEIE